MRISALFSVFLAVFILLCQQAQADPKGWFGWSSDHWKNQSYRPYMEGSRLPHNSQWDRDMWAPEDWATHGGGERAVMENLYRADIVTGQSVDGDNVPVLEVGDGFVNLSGQEKRRVVYFVDHVFGITRNAENGMFYIHHAELDKPLGLYTKYGLSLQ